MPEKRVFTPSSKFQIFSKISSGAQIVLIQIENICVIKWGVYKVYIDDISSAACTQIFCERQFLVKSQYWGKLLQLVWVKLLQLLLHAN